MSQAAKMGVEPTTMDPYEIGWYIESADEDTYGPVSRKTLRRFLEDATITPNTLVRHCTQPEARPAADQPGSWSSSVWKPQGWHSATKLAEAWPRKKRDQLALAEDALPCAWHKRPAVLVCVRCRAPYCNKCRAKPFRKQFFLCRRCQMGMWNRRFVALILDNLLLLRCPTIGDLVHDDCDGHDRRCRVDRDLWVQAVCFVLFLPRLHSSAAPGPASGPPVCAS